MKGKIIPFVLIFLITSYLSGCFPYSDQLIANQYAEAVLTKNNELEFRFKINQKNLETEEPYKVKVNIHNQELAAALGTNEIIYGEDIVHLGEYLEVSEEGHEFIFMTPVLLKKDLHPFEIEKMIVVDQAISIEVFNDQQILGKAFLKNFSTEL